jgi:hypothetical protein
VGVLVGHRGRPPKAGDRYPGGQLKPDTREPLAPALLRRIFRAAKEGYADARLASQVGRLLYHRELTSGEAGTAFHIAEIYGRFEAQHGTRRTTRSPSYETGFSSAGRATALLTSEDIERIQAIEAAWRALQDELEEYPRWVRGAIETLCVDDGAISSLYLADVRRVLAKLAMFFRSRRSKKSRRRRVSLMVVGPEHRAAPLPPAEPAHRIDRDKEAWLAVQRKLRPDLEDRELGEAYEIFVALKARAQFNDSKQTHC